jgi:hypothetical protein
VDPSTYLTDNVGSTSAIGVAFTFVMCLLLLGLPRRYALAPVIILTCFMTLGERLIIAGLDFTMIRVLLIAGWARVILRSEMHIGSLNAIDKTLIADAHCLHDLEHRHQHHSLGHRRGFHQQSGARV